MPYSTFVLGEQAAEDLMLTKQVELAQTPLPRTHSPVIHSDYLRYVLEPAAVEKFVKKAKRFLAKYEFDTIAFRGMSGALVAPVLAYAMHKTVLMVRKPKHLETNHSDSLVEGDIGARRYLIVDDFWCSGRTLEAIMTGVHLFCPDAKCIGALFYQSAIQHDVWEVTQNFPMKVSALGRLESPAQPKVCPANPRYIYDDNGQAISGDTTALNQ